MYIIFIILKKCKIFFITFISYWDWQLILRSRIVIFIYPIYVIFPLLFLFILYNKVSSPYFQFWFLNIKMWNFFLFLWGIMKSVSYYLTGAIIFIILIKYRASQIHKHSLTKHQMKRNLITGNATLYNRHHACFCTENMLASSGLIGKSASTVRQFVCEKIHICTHK